MAFIKLKDAALSADDIKQLRLTDPSRQRYALPQRVQSLQSYAPVYNGLVGESDEIADNAAKTDFSTKVVLSNEALVGDLINIRAAAKVTGNTGTLDISFTCELGASVLSTRSLAAGQPGDLVIFDIDVYPLGDGTGFARASAYGTEGNGTPMSSVGFAEVAALPGAELKLTCDMNTANAANKCELMFIGFTHTRPQTDVPEIPTAD